MRRKAVLLPVAVLALWSLKGRDARAQGFSVYEHNACAMARGGAAVASPCAGASAIFFNPAGLVGSPNRWNLEVGGTLIDIGFHFTDSLTGGTKTNNTGGPVPVPSVYYSRQVNDKWAWGIGMYAPYGLVVEWPTTFAGRFLSYRADLASLYFQPTFAYKPNNWIRLGGGLTYARTTVDLKQRVDLAQQVVPNPALPAGTTFGNLGIPAGTDFADAHLTGRGYSMGGHFGVILEPSRKISIGARYLMAMHARIKGDASFSQLSSGITLAAGNPFGVPGGTPMDSVVASSFRTGGPLVAQKATTVIPLPDQLIVGVALHPTPALDLLADWQWTNWSKFSSLPLSFEKLPLTTLYEDYQNTNGWRFGAEYRTGSLALRAGFLTHEHAAPDQTVTPLLPEGSRAEYTAGVGFKLSPRMHLDLAYQNIHQQDRRGRVVQPPVRGAAGTAYNTGLYTGGANLFGASISLVP